MTVNLLAVVLTRFLERLGCCFTVNSALVFELSRFLDRPCRIFLEQGHRLLTCGLLDHDRREVILQRLQLDFQVLDFTLFFDQKSIFLLSELLKVELLL